MRIEEEEEVAVVCFSRTWNVGNLPPGQGRIPASPNSSTLDTFFTLICYTHGASMHAVLMMPLLKQKRHLIQIPIMGGTSLVPMNDLDKRLEIGCLGSEGVLLQSSQVDHGHGVAKPGGAQQVSPVVESR